MNCEDQRADDERGEEIKKREGKGRRLIKQSEREEGGRESSRSSTLPTSDRKLICIVASRCTENRAYPIYVKRRVKKC